MGQQAIYWIDGRWQSLEVDNADNLDGKDSLDFSIVGHKHFKSEITDLPGVATISQDGFMSASDKTKLNNIAINANNYVHPNDASTRHISDTERTSWNAKADAVHPHTIDNVTGLREEINSIKNSIGNNIVKTASYNWKHTYQRTLSITNAAVAYHKKTYVKLGTIPGLSIGDSINIFLKSFTYKCRKIGTYVPSNHYGGVFFLRRDTSVVEGSIKLEANDLSNAWVNQNQVIQLNVLETSTDITFPDITFTHVMRAEKEISGNIPLDVYFWFGSASSGSVYADWNRDPCTIDVDVKIGYDLETLQ